MKNRILALVVSICFCSCKDAPKTAADEVKDVPEEHKVNDTLVHEQVQVEVEEAPAKSAKQIKAELDAKGFKVFYDIDPATKDTFLMQQYFMAFLKKGPIRGQNEEETAELQKQHLAHLTKMYALGYADISGPFGDDGDIRGITIYNVPNLKMADSLANSDPMVKAGRLSIEIHPWWAAKGFPLR